MLSSIIGINKQKGRETREQLKSCEAREVPYTCRYHILVDILIPNSVLVLEIKYPLVHLQV